MVLEKEMGERAPCVVLTKARQKVGSDFFDDAADAAKMIHAGNVKQVHALQAPAHHPKDDQRLLF